MAQRLEDLIERKVYPLGGNAGTNFIPDLLTEKCSKGTIFSFVVSLLGWLQSSKALKHVLNFKHASSPTESSEITHVVKVKHVFTCFVRWGPVC